ncbi:MAG: immunoglobulin-like domain-containing protein, partial [Limisphaerales bacterium]
IVVVEAPKDATPPTLSMLGNPVIEIEVGAAYSDPGVVAHDNIDDSVAVTINGSVDVNQPGNYVITYTAADSAGNQATPVTRLVIVAAKLDSEPPVIYLNGQNLIRVIKGTLFKDPGAEAIDNVDPVKSAAVSGTVNSQILGTYTLTYSAVDEAGNQATPVTRVVEVISADTVPPVITLKGDSVIILAPGPNNYDDPGASAVDDVDGELEVEVLGQVQWDKEGVYAYTYVAKDSAGNRATPVVRVIMVIASNELTNPNQTLSARQDRSEEPGRAASARVNDLRILRHGSGHWVIQWSGGGTLTHARTLTETFTPVPDATSPYRIPENQLGFYRLSTEGTQPLQ